MAEVQPRPSASRGRSSTRGGRGGHRNGPRHSQKQTNGDSSEAISQDISADSGELGELKQQYSAQLSTLKEMFPDWTDVDLLLGLQDCDGDLQRTTERITEGKLYADGFGVLKNSHFGVTSIYYARGVTDFWQEMCRSSRTSKRRPKIVLAPK